MPISLEDISLGIRENIGVPWTLMCAHGKLRFCCELKAQGFVRTIRMKNHFQTRKSVRLKSFENSQEMSEIKLDAILEPWEAACIMGGPEVQSNFALDD